MHMDMHVHTHMRAPRAYHAQYAASIPRMGCDHRADGFSSHPLSSPGDDYTGIGMRVCGYAGMHAVMGRVVHRGPPHCHLSSLHVCMHPSLLSRWSTPRIGAGEYIPVGVSLTRHTPHRVSVSDAHAGPLSVYILPPMYHYLSRHMVQPRAAVP